LIYALSKNNLPAKVSVDEGVNLDSMERIINAVADILILGTAVFNGNIIENIRNIREDLNHE